MYFIFECSLAFQSQLIVSISTHSLSSYLKHMRYCQIQRREICTMKVENKPSKREARVEEVHQWTFSTCSLEAEDECKEKEKVSFEFY